jgi:hypothetical protein
VKQWTAWGVVLAGVMLAGAAAIGADGKTAPDLNGDWRFDPKRSDAPMRPGGEAEAQGGREGRGGRGGGGWGGGGGGGRGGMGGRRGGGGGEGRGGPGGGEGRAGGGDARPMRMPDFMHVTETSTVVSFEDTSGHVLREITTVPAEADTFAHAPGAMRLTGQWKGAELDVQGAGGRGGRMSEMITLEDGGNTLVIHTRIEASGDRPARDFKRVYVRVSSS